MAATKCDFPFGIMEIAALVGIHMRRPGPGSVYADCPFCGDKRGKLNLNTAKNAFRCNHCGAGGGMLDLYGKLHGIGRSEAYREISDALRGGPSRPVPQANTTVKPMPRARQSQLAGIEDIHKTLSALFGMLTLDNRHRQALRNRGLTDGQIDAQGYRSTPAPHLAGAITKRLAEAGCVVQGVPGFYVEPGGAWTFRMPARIAGFFIPIRGIDGLLRGAQIRLDVPIKDKGDDKGGTKYLWFSSVSKELGVSSGSPVHYVGDACAHTVYVTEGALKGNIAHSLVNRTFACVAGVSTWRQLDPLFALLAERGTRLIVEAHDMDKFRNSAVDSGAAHIYALAHKHGIEARRLTWDPNYKGIDDWQLALRREQWLHSESPAGFMPAEECGDDTGVLPFRIYQLAFTAECPTIPFAFRGVAALRKAGYADPPAECYRLVHDGQLFCKGEMNEQQILALIAMRYRLALPPGYFGRSVAASDVLELYDGTGRRFFYCNGEDFAEVVFSPELALPVETPE